MAIVRTICYFKGEYEKRCSNSRSANLGLFLNWGGVWGCGGMGSRGISAEKEV